MNSTKCSKILKKITKYYRLAGKDPEYENISLICFFSLLCSPFLFYAAAQAYEIINIEKIVYSVAVILLISATFFLTIIIGFIMTRIICGFRMRNEE